MSGTEPSRVRASLFALDDATARGAYGALWASSPQRTPFSHIAFADAASVAFRLPARLVATVDDEGRWVAASILYEKRWGGVRAAAVPPLAYYLSPVLAGTLDAAEAHAHRTPLDVLLAEIERETKQAAFLLPPHFGDARPLGWAGWTLATRYTYITPLPVGADPTRWSSATRRLARRAADFEVDEDPRHVTAAVELMAASYRRQGTELGVDERSAEAVAHALVDAGLARAFAARQPGAVDAEAALVTAHDGHTAYYWIAGGRPGPAMTTLLARVLPILAADGFTTFDWCGANTPTISEFKRRFGPALVPFVRARRVGPRWMRALDCLRST